MSNTRPSVSRIHELLQYCSDTGELRWKSDRGNNKTVGKLAGCRRQDGYIVVRVDGRLCLGHHLAWVLTHGEWPAELLDHMNLDASKNRIENLRQANHSLNKANRTKTKANTSGFKGVFFDKDKARHARPWRAAIKVDYKSKHLGCFSTPEAAHAAYAHAAKNLFGEFARTA